MRFVLLIVVGLLGGALSGLFGVGGGIIMVPLLTTFAGMDQRRAAATSLVVIVPTSIVGAITYGLHGHVDVATGLIIGAGGIAGSLVGARLLRRLSIAWLRWLFVGPLTLVAIRLLFTIPNRGGEIDLGWGSVAGLVALGLAMGVASGLFGIGGGIIVVPILVSVFGVSDLVAKGTSLFAIVPASVVGSIANLRAHLVSLKDGIVVGIPAAAASVVASSFAFLLSPQLSNILFAILVLAAMAQNVWRGLRGRAQRG